MADGVFDIHSEFCKGVVVTFGLEHGVVAEAFTAVLLVGDGAVDNAFKLGHFLHSSATAGAHIASLYQRNDGAEACLAIVFSCQFGKQLLHIGLRVVAFATSIACAINTRCTVESLYFETGIVGKTAHMIVVIHILSLLQGILFKGLARFGNILMAADVG